MKKLSVIMPVYNVREYVRFAIESVILQTYANLEIILIDDGSTDGSGKICDEYAQKDQRITVLHQKHSGVSVAKNYGLKNIKGEYVTFCDSDDYIDRDMYQCMIDEIEKQEADIAECNLNIEYAEKSQIYPIKVDFEVCTAEKIMELVASGSEGAWLCTRVFKADLLRNIEFPENVPIGEDYTVLCETLAKANRVVRIPKPMYHYVQRGTSVSYTGYSKNSKYILENYINITSKMLKRYPDIQESLINYLVLQEMAIITSMSKANVYDIILAQAVKEEVRKYFREYLVSRQVNIFLKFCACLVCIYPKGLYYCFKWFIMPMRRRRL